MPDTAGSDPNKASCSEPGKYLPVAFAITNIVVLWVIYTMLHCLPMIADPSTASQGLVETIIFNIASFMVVLCYIRCALTHPGSIPDGKTGQSTWEYAPQGSKGLFDTSLSALGLQETKRTGDRRHCKWCAKYKPDRCHHCRVCRKCILRMDHHCPWIYNCVGFANHKYFFLLLFYTSIATNLIIWTMLGSVQTSMDTKTTFMTMFLLILGETLASFLGLVVTAFFLFHCWLMIRAMTTIEFCEKSMKRTGFNTSAYDRGFYGNLCAVLGDIPLLWCLPVSPPTGDGINFMTEEMPMRRLKEMEAGRGFRRLKPKGKKPGVMAGTGEYGSVASGPGSALSSAAELMSVQDPSKAVGDAPWASTS